MARLLEQAGYLGGIRYWHDRASSSEACGQKRMETRVDPPEEGLDPVFLALDLIGCVLARARRPPGDRTLSPCGRRLFAAILRAMLLSGAFASRMAGRGRGDSLF